MYWYNELTIAMNNNTAAMMTAKEILANTSIEEYCKGEFAQFANCLKVTGNEISCTDEASVRCETYELVLPEILKAIADQGYEFHGNSYWDSTYDTAWWEFSFDGKELSITFTFHAVDDEPIPGTGKTSSTRKYACPCCGLSVRATRVVRVSCMDCNEPLLLEG